MKAVMNCSLFFEQLQGLFGELFGKLQNLRSYYGMIIFHQNLEESPLTV